MQNRDQVILQIKKDFYQSERVISISSSVENPALSQRGIDLQLLTDRGSLSFRVRVSEYRAKYMFIKTDSAHGPDGIFESEADFIIQVYIDCAVIYETKPLINYLKKTLPKLPGIPASGRYINSPSCMGKLVSLELIERTNINYINIELADVIDQKYQHAELISPKDEPIELDLGDEGKTTVSEKFYPSKFRAFIELRRQSKKIANDAINQLNKPAF